MIRFFRGCHLVGYTASNVRNYTAASVQLSFERSLRVEISSGKQRLIIQLLQRFTSTCILVQGRMVPLWAWPDSRWNGKADFP
jgi:hypothetical protein